MKKAPTLSCVSVAQDNVDSQDAFQLLELVPGSWHRQRPQVLDWRQSSGTGREGLI